MLRLIRADKPRVRGGAIVAARASVTPLSFIYNAVILALALNLIVGQIG